MTGDQRDKAIKARIQIASAVMLLSDAGLTKQAAALRKIEGEVIAEVFLAQTKGKTGDTKRTRGVN
jgi:hypothetical protein